jgi:hypothetical protein
MAIRGQAPRFPVDPDSTSTVALFIFGLGQQENRASLAIGILIHEGFYAGIACIIAAEVLAAHSHLSTCWRMKSNSACGPFMK